MNKKLIIAIDGVVASGKGTLARLLAEKLGYIHIDSGALYRAVTYYALEKGLDTGDREGIVASLEEISIEFKKNTESGQNELWLGGECIEHLIRTPRVSDHVSEIGKIPEVRSFVNTIQRAHVEEGGIVIDGRDIGTVVLPEADLKIFLTADAEIRAERRFKEFQERGQEISFDEVLTSIQERDYADINREISPLKQASDAILVDSTHMTIPEVVDYAYNLALAKLSN